MTLCNVLKMLVMWSLWNGTFLRLKMGLAKAKNQSRQDHFWHLLMLQNFGEEVLHDFTQHLTLQTSILFKKYIFKREMLLRAYWNKALHAQSNTEYFTETYLWMTALLIYQQREMFDFTDFNCSYYIDVHVHKGMIIFHNTQLTEDFFPLFTQTQFSCFRFSFFYFLVIIPIIWTA